MTADDDFIGIPVVRGNGDSAPAGKSAANKPDPNDEPEPHDLLGEFSKAMHAAAESQHVRIAEELQRHRATQVKAIKARATSESAELKKVSQQEASEIDAWAAAATQLIATERAQKIDAQRETLEAELLRQEVIAERKVFAVEAAVLAHQTELDTFFSQLQRESDPVEIARLASSLPSFPSLSEAANAAMRQAAAESAPARRPAAFTLDTEFAPPYVPPAEPAAPQVVEADEPAPQAVAAEEPAGSVVPTDEIPQTYIEADEPSPGLVRASEPAAAVARSTERDEAVDRDAEVRGEHPDLAPDPGASSTNGPGIARPWPSPGASAVHAGNNSGASGTNHSPASGANDTSTDGTNQPSDADEADQSEAPPPQPSKTLLHSIPSTRPMSLQRLFSRKPDDDTGGTS